MLFQRNGLHIQSCICHWVWTLIPPPCRSLLLLPFDLLFFLQLRCSSLRPPILNPGWVLLKWNTLLKPGQESQASSFWLVGSPCSLRSKQAPGQLSRPGQVLCPASRLLVVTVASSSPGPLSPPLCALGLTDLWHFGPVLEIGSTELVWLFLLLHFTFANAEH